MKYVTAMRREAAWTAVALAVTAAAAVIATSGGTGQAIGALALFAGATSTIVRALGPRGRPFNEAASRPDVVEVELSGRRAWMPLWVALAWLLGTYGAFWTTGLATQVTNPDTLTGFVVSATSAFALGYALHIKLQPAVTTVPGNSWLTLRTGQRPIIAGAVYLALFGLIQMFEYGATSPGVVLQRVLDPGTAYQAKFDVYDAQQATGRVSAPMQLVTLAGALYGAACPLMIIYWRRLTLAIRATAIVGLLTYATYFLFIGTQKGLGDIVVMLLAGALAGAYGTWWIRGPRRRDRGKALRYAALAMTAFALYMVSAQTQRAEEFDTRDVTPPSPAVASLIGDTAATGVAATLFYPTHGYLGLSYNLGTPFHWTAGLGSSRVVASYATQYLGVAAPATYPARTENRTGWPAGQYWATIYPWLASDLTFPGAAAFMAALGWLFAKTWIEGAMKRDILALVIFGQLAIAVAYVPANNQLGVSRPTTIGILTLVAMYALRSVRRSAATPRPAASG